MILITVRLKLHPILLRKAADLVLAQPHPPKPEKVRATARWRTALRNRPWLVPGLGLGLGLVGVAMIPPSPQLAWLLGLGLPTGAALIMGLGWRLERNKTRALDQRMARIETLLAAHPALTLTLTPEGLALAAYGATPPSLPADSLFQDGLIEAVHPPDRPRVQAALKRAKSGAQAEVRFTPRLALDLRLSLTLRPLASSPDEAPRLIAVIMDASLQQAREEELTNARLEAEAQNMAKSRVLANVSHELRTPLNAVIGFSEIMVERLFGPLSDRYVDYARSIHDAGNHLLDMIGDLLDVSRIEADRYELTLESLDVREVIASALALVRVGADEKGVSLTAVMPPHPLRVRADRRALKQITLNLASNAIKFTPSGGAVTVAATALGHELELVVADTGLGIAPEDLARLGRPFEQAGEAGQRAQGTGLGLSLVRALTELHRGHMTLESRLGTGTAVTLKMPVVEQGRVEPNAPTQAKIIPLNRVG